WAAAWEDAAPEAAVTCSESGTRFGVAQPLSNDVLRAGDAAALHHPVGAEGIAMALRAGRLAAAWIGAGLRGAIPADRVAAQYAAAWQREFAAPVRWCARGHGAPARPGV